MKKHVTKLLESHNVDANLTKKVAKVSLGMYENYFVAKKGLKKVVLVPKFEKYLLKDWSWTSSISCVKNNIKEYLHMLGTH